MAKATEFEESHSIKAEGISTVKGLTEVGQQLFPLREKARSGKKLSKRDQKKLDELEREYRALEANIFALMRPKEPSPWLRGVDHTHSKRGPKTDDHAH